MAPPITAAAAAAPGDDAGGGGEPPGGTAPTFTPTAAAAAVSDIPLGGGLPAEAVEADECAVAAVAAGDGAVTPALVSAAVRDTEVLGVARCGTSRRTRATVHASADGAVDTAASIGDLSSATGTTPDLLVGEAGVAAVVPAEDGDAAWKPNAGLAAVAAVTRTTLMVRDVPCVEFTSTRSAPCPTRNAFGPDAKCCRS